jgi:hypothetical protein
MYRQTEERTEGNRSQACAVESNMERPRDDERGCKSKKKQGNTLITQDKNGPKVRVEEQPGLRKEEVKA